MWFSSSASRASLIVGVPKRGRIITAAHDPQPVRVLVVEDDQFLVNTVRVTLNHGSFEVRVVEDADGALGNVSDWRPHLAIIDMELGGPEVMRGLNGHSALAPVLSKIGLTRRGDLKTKLEAFALGADDIMTIPFAPEELLARAIAVLRRTARMEVPLRPVIKMGELEFDILNRAVRVGSSELHLTGLEQSLLYLLAGAGGQVVTREEIIDALWGPDFVSESNIVDRHVRNLRIKLQNSWRKPRYIKTVPGKGYKFIAESTGPVMEPR